MLNKNLGKVNDKILNYSLASEAEINKLDSLESEYETLKKEVEEISALFKDGKKVNKEFFSGEAYVTLRTQQGNKMLSY